LCGTGGLAWGWSESAGVGTDGVPAGFGVGLAVVLMKASQEYHRRSQPWCLALLALGGPRLKSLGRIRCGSLWWSRVLSVARSLRERGGCLSRGIVLFRRDKPPRSLRERATLRPQPKPSPTGYPQITQDIVATI
jgi:hypothetical protein